MQTDTFQGRGFPGRWRTTAIWLSDKQLPVWCSSSAETGKPQHTPWCSHQHVRLFHRKYPGSEIGGWNSLALQAPVAGSIFNPSWIIPCLLLSQDNRLKFTNLSEEIKLIEGEDWFTKSIWTPNIFIENERESTLMKTTRDSTFVRIHDTTTIG